MFSQVHNCHNTHGDVENVEVANVEIGEVYAIEVADGYVQSEAEANVAYSADVSYEDFDTGFYDKESGRYVMTKFVNLEAEDESKVTVLFDFSLDEDANPVASDVSIAEETISVEEEDRGDYGMYK